MLAITAARAHMAAMRRSLLKWLAITVGAFAGAVGFAAFCLWFVSGSISLDLEGFGLWALVAAAVVTGGLTIALMALMVHSQRSGKDHAVYRERED